MILTITPNPCVDKTVYLDSIELGTFMRCERYSCVPGGKGTNVSRAVHALGRETKALVIVGSHSGAHVVDMITHQDGVAFIPVWVSGPTRTITTVLEESIHRQTAFFEPGPRVSSAEAKSLLEAFETAVQDARVVTFNGTVPDRSIEGIYQDMIRIARSHDVYTILDSHGPEFACGLQSAPYMAKPNRAEAEEWSGLLLDSDAALQRAADTIHALGVTLVCISLGKEGAYISREGVHLRAHPPAIQEVNPVGSGDAFTAGFAIGIMENMSLEETARLACAAGAANAMSWDIGHFTREEVLALLPETRITYL